MARALQSKIFPGVSLADSFRLKLGEDLKVLLESDLLAQPLMLARLVGEELPAPPPAVKAPTPEPGPPPRSTAPKETAAPASASAPAIVEPLPAAASADKSNMLEGHSFQAAAERAESGFPVRNGTRTQNLANLTPLLAPPDFNIVEVGYQIDPGEVAPAIYCGTGAEQVARGLQSEVYPGASLEASSRPQPAADLKKSLLGSELLAQPLRLARWLGQEKAAAPLAALAGAIRVHIDNRGVLYIGNVTPIQPTPSQPDSPSAVREAMITEPRRSQDRHVRLVGQTEETYNPEADLDAIQQACQSLVRGEPPVHEFDGISVAAGQAATEQEAVEVAAVGDIQRYRDARGFLHLSNVPPSQPTPSQPDSPSAVREAMITEPRRSQDRHVRLVGQTEETYNPEADLDAIQKACQDLALGEAPAHEFDGIGVAAQQAAAAKDTVEVAMAVSQLAQEQGDILAPAPEPAATKTAEAAAAGDIQRYRDARGVLHLSNVAPSQPTPSQPDSPSAVSEAMMTEPRRGRNHYVRSVSQTEESYNPEADLDAIEKACQGLVRGEAPAHEFDGIIVAAEQAATAQAAAEVAVDYNYLPVRQVAQNQGVTPAPAPQPAAPKIAEAATGDIQHYRDAQGVLHLSNATPGAEGLGAAVQMAQNPNNQGGEARQLVQPAAMLPRQPFRQAAWSPDDLRPATLPTTPFAAKQAPPDSPNPVWEYRDSKSVIHISNVDPKRREAPQPDSLMASSTAGSEPLAGRPRPVSVETAGGLAWRPAAWNGEGGIKPFKRAKQAPSQTAEVITEGGIRRYRDAKGIIHIKTVEYPLPPGVVLPPRQPDPYLMAPVAAAPPAPVISNLPRPATSAPPANPATPSGAKPRITAFKDAKGRLRITTELPPPVPGEMPPLPVYAELEPIIQEAAQSYRLPPTLIKAVIKAESNFCSWAVSPKGAMGLMQLMPGTADLLGVREPFNPRENILGGCRYLRELVDLFGGNLPLALASYNAGFQRVIDCGYQIPSIKETQEFVTAVMGRYVAEENRGRRPST